MVHEDLYTTARIRPLSDMGGHWQGYRKARTWADLHPKRFVLDFIPTIVSKCSSRDISLETIVTIQVRNNNILYYMWLPWKNPKVKFSDRLDVRYNKRRGFEDYAKSYGSNNWIEYIKSGVEHGILQARTWEWVAIPFFKGFPQPRDQTWVFHIADKFFIIWATREASSAEMDLIWKHLNSLRNGKNGETRRWWMDKEREGCWNTKVNIPWHWVWR